jgi:hypothetical protein
VTVKETVGIAMNTPPFAIKRPFEYAYQAKVVPKLIELTTIEKYDDCCKTREDKKGRVATLPFLS